MKTFGVTCLDKQGQVLSIEQYVCPKPDSFNRLITEMYRKGLLDPAGKRVRDWEELQDKGAYTYSEDAPLDRRVTDVRGLGRAMGEDPTSTATLTFPKARRLGT